jgi:hypothetical protein
VWKKRKYLPDTTPYIRVVGDGLIASQPIGEGRMFPVLILDTRDHPGLVELVKAHATAPPGDVVTTWCTVEGDSDAVGLSLQFERPMEYSCALLFSLSSQGVLVDQILSTRGCYLQPGKPGDRLSKTLGSPQILIEVPLTGFEADWEAMYDKVLNRRFRDSGLGRRAARRAAQDLKTEWRKKLGTFRKR